MNFCIKLNGIKKKQYLGTFRGYPHRTFTTMLNKTNHFQYTENIHRSLRAENFFPVLWKNTTIPYQIQEKPNK